MKLYANHLTVLDRQTPLSDISAKLITNHLMVFSSVNVQFMLSVYSVTVMSVFQCVVNADVSASMFLYTMLYVYDVTLYMYVV